MQGARTAPTERTVLSFVDEGTERQVPGVIAGLHEAAARRRRMFPRPGQAGLFAIGLRRELLDRALSDLPLGEASALATVIDVGQLQSLFSRDATPRVVQGRWLGETPLDLVLAVNGIVRSTTRGLAADTLGLQHFTMFVPQSALNDEGNRLALYEVTGSPRSEGAPTLHPVAAGAGAYELRGEGGRLWLVGPRGQSVPVVEDALRGRFQLREPAHGDVAVTGWAYDARGKRPVQAVAVFAGSRFLFSVKADVESPCLIEMFGPGASRAGYRVVLRAERLGGAALSALRIFAVSAAGEATELGGTY